MANTERFNMFLSIGLDDRTYQLLDRYVTVLEQKQAQALTPITEKTQKCEDLRVESIAPASQGAAKGEEDQEQPLPPEPLRTQESHSANTAKANTSESSNSSLLSAEDWGKIKRFISRNTENTQAYDKYMRLARQHLADALAEKTSSNEAYLYIMNRLRDDFEDDQRKSENISQPEHKKLIEKPWWFEKYVEYLRNGGEPTTNPAALFESKHSADSQDSLEDDPADFADKLDHLRNKINTTKSAKAHSLFKEAAKNTQSEFEEKYPEAYNEWLEAYEEAVKTQAIRGFDHSRNDFIA